MPDPVIEGGIKGAISPGVEKTSNKQEQADQQHAGEATEDETPCPALSGTANSTVGSAMDADVAVVRHSNLRDAGTWVVNAVIRRYATRLRGR